MGFVEEVCFTFVPENIGLYNIKLYKVFPTWIDILRSSCCNLMKIGFAPD